MLVALSISSATAHTLPITATAQSNGKWGAVNADNDYILPPVFDRVDIFTSPARNIFGWDDGKLHIIDHNHRLLHVTEQKYLSIAAPHAMLDSNPYADIIPVEIAKGKWSIINYMGEPLTDILFDSAPTFHKYFVIGYIGGKCCVLNYHFNYIIEPEYDKIDIVHFEGIKGVCFMAHKRNRATLLGENGHSLIFTTPFSRKYPKQELQVKAVARNRAKLDAANHSLQQIADALSTSLAANTESYVLSLANYPDSKRDDYYNFSIYYSDKAHYWLYRAAMAGHSKAQAELVALMQDKDFIPSVDKYTKYRLLYDAYYAGRKECGEQLGDCYLNGLGVDQNLYTALELFLESYSTAPHPNSALEKIADCYLAWGGKGDCTVARHIYKKVGATQKEAHCAQLLKQMRIDAQIVLNPHDYTQQAYNDIDAGDQHHYVGSYNSAYHYYKRAADTGSPYATMQIARIYLAERRGFRNDAKTIYWLKKLLDCTTNNVSIYAHIADIYYRTGDYQQALQYAKTAAQMGDSKAHYLCAECYLLGRGTAVDAQKYMEHLIAAASEGECAAMLKVASNYFTSAYEYSKALRFYLAAAITDSEEQIISASLYNIGAIFYNRERFEAEFWLQKAVERGYTDAKELLYTVRDI